LVLEAIHGGGTHNIFGIHVPEISTQFSLSVIVITLVITIAASLARSSKSKVAE
jgi:tellurite resistance protein TerC